MPLLAEDPAAEPGEVQARIDELLAEAIAANADFYRRLRDLCAAPSDPDATSQLRTMFAEVSEHQLVLLEEAQRALAGAAQ